MRIGIYSWWRKQGVSYVTCQLATRLEKLGHKVSIFSPNMSLGVHPEEMRWLGLPSKSYEDWFEEYAPETMFFVYHCPHKEVFLARQKKIPVHYVVFWERTKEYRGSMDICTSLIAPTNYCKNHLAKMNFRKKVNLISWGLDMPVSSPKHYKDDTIKLLYIQGFPESRRRGDFAFGVMNHLMDFRSNVESEIIYVDSIHSRDQKSFNDFMLVKSNRITVRSNVSHEEILQSVRNADLLLWPTCREGLGLIGLESIYSGTPVLGFSVPPLDEYLTPANSFMCRQPLGWSYEKIPEIVNPSYVNYLELADRNFSRLRTMNLPVLQSAHMRSALFNDHWNQFTRNHL